MSCVFLIHIYNILKRNCMCVKTKYHDYVVVVGLLHLHFSVLFFVEVRNFSIVQ